MARSPLRRNGETLLYGRSCQAALQPCPNVREVIEAYEFARFIEADQVAHPAEQRDIGDGVVIAHDPLAALQPVVEHADQPPRFIAIALQRAFVGDLAAGEFVEEAELAE